MIALPLQSGYPSTIYLDFMNGGCAYEEVTIKFLPDPYVTVLSNNFPGTQYVGDTLMWSIYESINSSYPHFPIVLDVLVSQEALLGDTLCFNVQILPIENDIEPENNIKNYCIPVLNAYDPNIISVIPHGICDNHYVEKTDKLTYTIQFQNTGNASAINIFVRDNLSEHLDLNTLKVVAMSHYMTVDVVDDNVIDFKFDNIYLPDSASNEPQSHGYLAFEIYSKVNIPDNTVNPNQAAIYFDFNDPIFTNTVYQRIMYTIPDCSEILSVDALTEDKLLIFPNPTLGLFSLFNPYDSGTIEVWDTFGKNHAVQKVNSGNNILDFQNLSSGIYMIKLNNNGHANTLRLIIEK